MVSYSIKKCTYWGTGCHCTNSVLVKTNDTAALYIMRAVQTQDAMKREKRPTKENLKSEI